jgi:cephalosporin-C deacetylase
MPLDKLQQYQGRNPKPADFEAFWEKALAEMRGIDARVELIPHALETPFAGLYFTGAQGARVHAELLRRKKIEKPAPDGVKFQPSRQHSAQQ